jgi:hypothetical protein
MENSKQLTFFILVILLLDDAGMLGGGQPVALEEL